MLMTDLFHPFVNVRRVLRRWLLALALVLLTQLVAAPVWATGVYEIPDFVENTWVVDQAEVLSRTSEGQLSSDLEALARKTGTEVRIVTIHRLDYGETAETLARQVFEKWFPDATAQANQVLMLLDNVTNGTAIVSGEKAQVRLSDDIARSVAQETLMVPIRKGNYNQALLDGSARLSAVLSGEPDPGPPKVEDTVRTEGTFKKAEETNATSAAILVGVLLILATAIPMATYYFYQYMQAR